MARWTCNLCAWVGGDDELLRAPNPFDTDTIYGCPFCKSVLNIVRACDEPGCKRASSCGLPTSKGYRVLCDWHAKIVELEG